MTGGLVSQGARWVDSHLLVQVSATAFQDGARAELHLTAAAVQARLMAASRCQRQQNEASFACCVTEQCMQAQRAMAGEEGRVGVERMPDPRMKRVAVVGAGVSGLSAAYLLNRSALQLAAPDSALQSDPALLLSTTDGAMPMPDAINRPIDCRIVKLRTCKAGCLACRRLHYSVHTIDSFWHHL